MRLRLLKRFLVEILGWQQWAISEKNTFRTYFFENSPEIFRCHFITGGFKQKKSFILGSSAKWCYNFWKFLDQKPRSMEIPHNLFLITPGNSTFLINTWNFHILFLQYRWKFHVLNRPCLDFFWNSLIGRCSC